jgi:hypothetical protein
MGVWSLRQAFILCAPLVFAGCPGGMSTAEPVPDTVVARCERAVRDLRSLEEITPIGLRASDVVDLVARTHHASIHWKPWQSGSYGPESGSHELTLRLRPTSAPARLVTYSPRTSDGAPTLLGDEASGPCESDDAVEIDVEVEVDTDAGALHEQGVGVVVARNASWAQLQFRVQAQGLRGAFAASPGQLSGDLELASLDFQFAVLPFGVTGTLQGLFSDRDSNAGKMAEDESASLGGVSFASFGSGNGCGDQGIELTLEQPLGTFTGRAAIEVLNGVRDVTGTWQDGTESRFTFGFVQEGSPVCVIWVSGVPRLRMLGLMTADSGDGRVHARWPVVLDARPGEHEDLADIAVALQASAPEVTDASLRGAYGLADAGVNRYGRVLLGMELSVQLTDMATRVEGQLSVTGVNASDCKRPVGADASTASCNGDDVMTILSLAWTSP